MLRGLAPPFRNPVISSFRSTLSRQCEFRVPAPPCEFSNGTFPPPVYVVPPMVLNAAIAFRPLKKVSRPVPLVGDGFCSRPLVLQMVPMPSTCPISWSITLPKVPAVSSPARSAVSNCIVPRIGSEPTLRVKHGPAEPRICPTPSIGSSRTMIATSSKVSLIAPGLLQLPAPKFSGCAAMSPVMIDSQRAAALLNVCSCVGVGIATNRSEISKPALEALPDAENTTGFPVTMPAIVAESTFVPAAIVQLPAVAIPLAFVIAVALEMLPTPGRVANVTCTLATGVPASSFTITEGALPTTAPGAAIWPFGELAAMRTGTPSVAARTERPYGPGWLGSSVVALIR